MPDRTKTRLLILTLASGLCMSAHGQFLDPPPEPTTNPAGLLASAAISFDRTTHDFGNILDEANVETTFTFTNSGDTTLEILDHRATCGCTVPEISKRSLLPGESATIKVVFHPAHKRGQQNQTVTLMTNSPEQPQVPLTITANVRPMTWADPVVAHFSRIEKGDPRTIQIDVYSRVPDFKVEAVNMTNDVVFRAAASEPVEVPGDSEGEKLRKVSIAISLSPTVPLGNHTETLQIRTNDPKKPVLNQQVIAEVIGDLLPAPNRVSLGVVRPGDPLKSEFKISSRSGKPFKILSAKAVATTGVQIDAVVEQVAEGGATEIKITLSGTAPGVVQPIRGKVEITTDSKEQPKIEVPFYATVRGGQR